MASDSHYLSVILSAFEELKEGKRGGLQEAGIELRVEPSGHSHATNRSKNVFLPLEDTDDRMSREGSEADGSTGSDPFSVSGGRSRSSRDERAALEAGLPLTAAEIIRMPVEEFNGYISGQVGQLRPEQIQMMKDIRRRGKNKVAAQNCRKRKIDNMSHLEREIMGIREELKRESQRRDELIRERDLHRVALARIPVIQPTSVAPQSSSSTTEPAPVITRSSHGHVPSSVVAKERVAKPIRKRKQPEEQ